MKYSIIFDERVLKDLQKISSPDKKKIQKAIEQKLSTRPEIFGKPLRSNLKNLWSLRVGFYRVIYQIQNGECVILVVAIGKRSDVYER